MIISTDKIQRKYSLTCAANPRINVMADNINEPLDSINEPFDICTTRERSYKRIVSAVSQEHLLTPCGIVLYNWCHTWSDSMNGQAILNFFVDMEYVAFLFDGFLCCWFPTLFQIYLIERNTNAKLRFVIDVFPVNRDINSNKKYL